MHDKRGNVLPLAVILTSMILMAGVGIGVVVLQGSQRAVEIDQSVSAYYMADSGIERQLYEVRKDNATAKSLSDLNEHYPNQGSWSFYGGYATTTQKIMSSIATSSFEVIDLFNPDNVSAAGVDHMDMSWTNGANCTGGLEAGMEIGYAEWGTSGGTITLSNQYTIQRSAVNAHSMIVPLDPTKAYRIRLTSLVCTAIDVTAQTFDASNIPRGFPGDITLAAEGTYGKATQKIDVTMPKTNILSGVFSYVIFSECTLIKGTGTPVCPP